MPRIARAIVPGIPHHVTQRGNRRQDVFFTETDRERYLLWLGKYARENHLKIWAYCLMSNHVHLVSVPQTEDSLADALRNLHMRHAQHVNTVRGWQGHLWQGRFFSSSLDDHHLAAAVRYVELNPVRSGLVRRAEDYPWSSAAAHCGLRKDRLLSTDVPLLQWVDDWSQWVNIQEDPATLEYLRSRTMKGLPCGSADFVAGIEKELGRSLMERPKGRPRKKGTEPFSRF